MKNIQSQPITETLEKNYMPYAMSVIVSRAIPEIDGFKPSHRKLLYTMYRMKLLTGSKTKSANVVGQTMKLNPHGDQAIYETLVRLTRGHDALLHPYIDSKGNFGKSSSRDMRYAASRYTEVKLDGICEEIFKDIDRETVPFMDNYDGKMKEPTLLPTTFPNVLVNCNKGIAVGMASNICSFNLKEVCEATIALIDNPEVSLHETLKAPDFSTGAQLIYNPETMRKIFETGQGSFKLRSKYRFNKAENCIEVYEIPYTTTTEQILEKVADLIKQGKIREINDLRDETDLKGLKVTFDLKRGTDPDKLMHKLYRSTPLEDSYSCNFNMLIDGRPIVLGVRSILTEWLRFRVRCIRNRTAYDIKDLESRLHLMKGLERVILDIDKAIRLIRETAEDKLVIPNLMSGFDLDQIQAEYVADIRLRNINREYLLKRISEVQELERTLMRLHDLMSSEKKIHQLIQKELSAIIKTYARPRRTEIISGEDIDVPDTEDLVEDYNLRLFFTDHNYIKKVSMVSLRSSTTHKIKDNDYISQEWDATNRSDVLFFSNRCNVYKMKVYELEDHKTSSLGTYLPNILGMEEGEEITYMLPTISYEGFMIFVYDNGKVAKVPLSSYQTKTNRKKLIKSYSDAAQLVKMVWIPEDTDLMLYRYNQPDEIRALLFNTGMLTEKSARNTLGIQAVRMKKGSVVTQAQLLSETPINDPELYRIKMIPMSGTVLDMMDRLTLKAGESGN